MRIPVAHTLQPKLVQNDSNWQKAINHAGYAPTRDDVRSSSGDVQGGPSDKPRYLHTRSAAILTAATPVKAALSGKKGGAIAVDSRAQTLSALRKDCEAHYARAVQTMAKEIPSRFWAKGAHTLQTFEAEAKAHLEAIANRVLSDGDQMPPEKVRDKILKAAIESERYLTDLRAQYSDELDKAPQLFLSNGKVTVIRPAPPPENMSLRGGGAKGIGFIGEMRALERAGVLKSVRCIAGTSAGALTASLMAGGLTADEFGKVSRSKSPLRMAWDGDSDVALKFGKVGFSASAVVSLIDGAIKNSIKDFLARDPSPDLTGLSAAEQQEIRDLASAPVSQPVTFRHLKLLAGVEPQRFKELTLAIFDSTEKRTKHIHADNHPDWSVGETARMSMAIPAIFKSVTGPDGHAYQDGGLGSNMPSEVFVRPDFKSIPSALLQENGRAAWTPKMQAHLDALQQSAGRGDMPSSAEQADQSAKTLLISFDEEGKFYETVNQGKLFSNPSLTRKAFGASAETNAADRIKMYSAGPNALPAFHGRLDTMSLRASARKLDLVELFSQAKALEHVRQQLPMDRATYEVQDGLDRALETLTNDELALLRKACIDRIENGRANPALAPDKKTGEVPDEELLREVDAQLQSRRQDVLLTTEQLRTVPGLRETARQIQTELSQAQSVAPGLLTPRQTALYAAQAKGGQALQSLVLRDHLLKQLEIGLQGLRMIQDPQPDAQALETGNTASHRELDASSQMDVGEIDAQDKGERQLAFDGLEQSIALLTGSPGLADPAALMALLKMAGDAKTTKPGEWMALADAIKTQAPEVKPPLTDPPSLAVGQDVRLTMPRALSPSNPLAIAPRDAAEKVRRGVQAAQETGVARPGSGGGGWFARVAKVTAGLLGMAGAAALSVLFPPAAPLIYVGAMAVAAGVAAAAQQGQNRHISQNALQHDVERQRREARTYSLA
jgi:predicted acylesterase/phospholipase RssA